MTARKHPPASRHGELEELFDDVFFVSGTVRMPGPLPMVFSRNMSVLREGRELTLVNTMRLDEQGLAALDALGEVKRTIRVAGFHGMDDAFYQERYGAEVWALEGMRYVAGLDGKGEPYLQPDVRIDAQTELPLAGASLYSFEGAKVPEGVLLLEREGGIAIAGDSLQNWVSTAAYFSLPAKLVMRMMGFIKPHNVGPGWLKGARPKAADLEGLLELPFEHLLPAHGDAVVGDAKQRFRPSIERAIRTLR